MTCNTLYIFLNVRYTSCCWINELVAGGRGWELKVKGNLTRRADNGLINTSPISTMPPIVRLQHGCNHTIVIPGKAEMIDSIQHQKIAINQKFFFIQWQILMKISFDVGGLSFLRVNAMALVGAYPMLP